MEVTGPEGRRWGDDRSDDEDGDDDMGVGGGGGKGGGGGLQLQKVANYVSHEQVVVDTADHEDHFFNGVLFDVVPCVILPIETVAIESLWVRGHLGGPVTVWTTPESHAGKHATPSAWRKIYDVAHAARQDASDYVELKLAGTVPESRIRVGAG